jgi:cytochrome c oxidase subunit 2
MKSNQLLAAAVSTLLSMVFCADSAIAQDLDRGEVLYGLCTQCHQSDGGGDSAIQAPSIAGMEAWYVEAQLKKFKSGDRGAHPDDIAGMRMRPMSLTLKTDEDIAAVAAFVAAMPAIDPGPTLAGGDPARGKILYGPCTACHGPIGEGNPQLNGPALNRSHDWYQVDQLKKFKGKIRGSNPQDQTGAMMAAMAGTLADEQAMIDVVSYIMTMQPSQQK